MRTPMRILPLLQLAVILSLGVAKSSAGNDAAYADLTEIESLLERVRIDYFSCGPKALALALRLHGHSLRLENVLDSVEITPAGVTLAELLTVARRFEPKARAVISEQKSMDGVSLPAVVVLQGTHAVVLLEVDETSNSVTIADSAGYYVVRITADSFRSKWTGEALVFPKSYGTDVLLLMEVVAVVATVAPLLLFRWIYRLQQPMGMRD